MVTRLSLAMQAARAVGLPDGDPLVLSDHSTLVVHLRPATVIARVGRLPDHTARELRIGRHLAARCAPAVRPLDLPAIGLVGFWHLLPDGTRGRLPAAVPEDAGQALRAVHEALADLPDALPRLGSWTAEVPDWLEAAPPGIRQAYDRLDTHLADLPAGQALHGDAHLGNCWGRPAVWGDLEEAGRGPVEWDLAALVLGRRLTGSPDGDRALAAYGAHDEAVLARLLPARALLAVAWRHATKNLSDPYAAHLSFLRQHLP